MSPRSSLCVVLFAFASTLTAQTTTPNTSFQVPDPHGIVAEAEISGFDAVSFNRYGYDSKIPGTLRFFTGSMRLSWAPVRRIAIGAELPDRVVEYRADLGARALRNSGMTGIGIFADFAHHPLGLDAVLRAGYFRAAKERDPVLTASDGLNRYSLAWAAGTPAGSRRPLVAFGRLELSYGPPAYYAGLLQIAAGRRLGPRLDLMIVANRAVTTVTYDQGSYFENRDGGSAEAGILLQGRAGAGVRLRLSATRTLMVRNGLDGTRVTLSVVRSMRNRQ